MIVRSALTAGAALALVAGTVSPATAVGATPLACAQPDGRVTAIAVSGGVAYLGGRFTAVKDKGGTVRARAHLAAVDTSTCDLLPWQADTNGEVMALAVSSGVVFAGGAFTTVKGLSRARLAGVTTGGSVTSFSPGLDGTVNALTTRNGVVYAGGAFTHAGASTRTRLAAWSVSSGALVSSWTPSSPSKVLSLAADSTRVYVAGGFTKLNGLTSARHLAAVDPTTGAVDGSFRPGVSFPVDQVVTDSRGVYAAGAGGGGKVGLWNRNGSLQRPIYVTDGDVQTVAVGASSVYAGGHFANFCQGGKSSGTPPTCLNPLPRKKALEIALSSGAVTGWAPTLNSPLGAFSSAVDPATGRLWMGGDFTQVNAKPVGHLAVFP